MATRLSPSEIYGYARGAGLSPAKAITATAIALAESGGDPTNRCHDCAGVPEDSRGLWQINVDPNAHPELKNWNLFDPATNARAMAQVSNGGASFSPWTTYTHGTYTTYLGEATSAAAGDPVATTNSPQMTTTAATSGGSSSGVNWNPLDGFGIPSAISSSIGKDALRVVIEGVLILGGASLVVVGLYRAVQPAVQKVATVAGDAAKTGAAAAAV